MNCLLNSWDSSRLSRKDHIAYLRRRFCPEGRSSLPKDAQHSLDVLSRQLDNSINKLSMDLYSTDAHCLLELVQNADDNMYSVLVPTLKLQVEPDRIIVRNNECGFTAANVEAICSIGESTKSKARGYIGEKGIGFKSVFKIADHVYINSRGYSFCFNAKRQLGMIDPEWAPLAAQPSHAGWTTIGLVLKSHIDRQRLEQQCADVHPFLLLFLNKLRRLEVTACRVTRVYERAQQGDEVTITICNRTSNRRTCYRFYVHSTTISMPEHLQVKPRARVATTDLVLAFPSDASGAALAISSQMLHAFLPVRDYGFKFLIQADFIVPSSREAIDEDSPWNKQLQQQLPSAFQQALLSMQQLPALRASFLNYVPLAGQVSGPFFSQLADRMRNCVCQSDAFLTADGLWTCTSKVLQPGDTFTYGQERKPLVSNAQLLAACGKRFLHADVVAAVHKSTLSALGCWTFGVSDLVCVCAAFGSGGISDPSWFMGVYAALHLWGQASTPLWARRSFSGEVLSLRTASIFLLQDGSVVSAEGVYLPCDSMGRFTELLPGGTAALRVLHAGSYSPHVEELLAAWGIERLSEEGVLVPALLAQYRSALPMLSTQQHLDHVHFLYEHSHNAAVMQQAHAQLKLLTTAGGWVAPGAVYVPGAGCGWSLQALLPDGSFLAPLYSELSTEEQNWLQSGLGIAALPRVDTATGQLSAEFEALLSQPGRSGQLLCMLRDCYGSYIQQMGHGGWLPAHVRFRQSLQSMQVCCTDGSVHALSDCYLPTKAMQCLMGASTPCVNVPDPDSLSWTFLSDLGVSREASVATYLRRLQQLSIANERPPVVTVVAMYSFLSSQFAAYSADICSAFTSARLIYLPQGSISSLHTNHAWAPLSAVLWEGDGRIFAQQVFLHSVKQYKGLEPFFVQQLGVRSAGLQDLSGVLLDRVSKPATAITQEDRQAILQIYRELSHWVDHDTSGTASPAVSALLEQPVLLVRRGGKPAGCTAADGSVYVCRSQHMEQAFGAEVKVLDVPCEQLALLQGLLSCASGSNAIKDIADELEEVAVWEKESQEQLQEGWLDELQQAAPLLARCLYHVDTKQFMEQLKGGQLLRLARGVRLYAVSGLHTVQSFRGTQQRSSRLVTHEVTADGHMHLYVSQESLRSEVGAANAHMQLRMLYSSLWSTKPEFSSLGHTVLAYGQGLASQWLCSIGVPDLPQELSSLDPSSYSSAFMHLSTTQGMAACHSNTTAAAATAAGAYVMQHHAAAANAGTAGTAGRIPVVSMPLAMANGGTPIQGSSTWQQYKLSHATRCTTPGAGAANRSNGAVPAHAPVPVPVAVAVEMKVEAVSASLLERQQAVVASVRAAPAMRLADLIAAPQPQQQASGLPQGAMGSSRVAEAFAAQRTTQAASAGPAPAPGQNHEQPTASQQPPPAQTSNTSQPATMLGHQIIWPNLQHSQNSRIAAAAAAQSSGAAAAAPPNPAITDDIGYLGEVFVYEQLRKLLPDFGPDNWTSAARCCYGLGDHYTDAGADFVYKDVNGMLTEGTAMAGNSPQCFIEVKATAGDGSRGFFISNREWEVARQLDWERRGYLIPALYMIVRVGGINSSSPHIHRVLLDPSGMLRRGELELTGSNLWIDSFA